MSRVRRWLLVGCPLLFSQPLIAAAPKPQPHRAPPAAKPQPERERVAIPVLPLDVRCQTNQPAAMVRGTYVTFPVNYCGVVSIDHAGRRIIAYYTLPQREGTYASPWPSRSLLSWAKKLQSAFDDGSANVTELADICINHHAELKPSEAGGCPPILFAAGKLDEARRQALAGLRAGGKGSDGNLPALIFAAATILLAEGDEKDWVETRQTARMMLHACTSNSCATGLEIDDQLNGE